MVSFPSAILELKNLGTLLAFDLVEVSNEIIQLSNLRKLVLIGSKLEPFPPGICYLKNLEYLGVGYCGLKTLPPKVAQLNKLRRLNLNSNNLTSLPKEISLLPELKELNVERNPLTSPPPAIVQQGIDAIKAYLRAQSEDSTRQWVSKLLIVGEGGVGKTSLLNALQGEPFDQSESTTHGIEIQTLDLPHPTESDVTMHLNAWDFGGQEIYHATHQFFLTNRSLFLLAWNARLGFEQGKLYYWLDTIKVRAPESPVLIVATHVDERDANIPLSELRRKYPQITGYYEISNKTGAGIEELREAIISAAEGLPLMGERWPTDWLNAANAIRSTRKTNITPNELRAVMAQHNVLDDKAAVLARWLHELGDILYFQDDVELNDTVILDPQWVTQSISKVLVSEEVKRRIGLFTRAHMDELWSDIDPAMRNHFLRLMEKFDLSYRTLEDRDISLVVERLSHNPPEYEETWEAIKGHAPCKEMSMKFVLDTAMPAGIPTWFIARAHRFTTHTHWLYGALFADSPERKHLGLIQAFPHDRYVKLTVRGSLPHNFFTLLWDGLEYIFRRFPGLNIERRIPCPGHDGQPCRHEFDLVNLQKAIERERPVLEIQCPVSLENVSVTGLLFGLHWSTTNEIISRLDRLAQSEGAHHEDVMSYLELVRDDLQELRELVQREFINTFRREQAKVDSQCPNVFILRPRETNRWLKAIKGQKMELQLYCQAPGLWHPALEGGLYEIDQPAPWLRAIAPYVKGMVSVLKYAAPLVAPGLSISLPEYAKQFENEIKLMEELVDKMPEIEDTPDIAMSLEQAEHPERTGGASLRALRLLLEEKDPTRHWGGLQLVPTPEGHYFWLCKQHAVAYTQ
jgi:small GTP-binding protein